MSCHSGLLVASLAWCQSFMWHLSWTVYFLFFSLFDDPSVPCLMILQFHNASRTPYWLSPAFKSLWWCSLDLKPSHQEARRTPLSSSGFGGRPLPPTAEILRFSQYLVRDGSKHADTVFPHPYILSAVVLSYMSQYKRCVTHHSGSYTFADFSNGACYVLLWDS